MADENQDQPFEAKAVTGRQEPPKDPPKPKSKSILILAIFAVIGIVIAGLMATNNWPTGTPSGRYDLGTVVSSPDGLNGHLYTEWDGRIKYRIRIEPGDQKQLAGFSLAAGHAPRPVSFYIQLLDAKDFALCGMKILLKYDPADADELAREHGKDVFQNVIGGNGQIVAISSQGTMPCSSSAWGNAVSWTFTSNFPSLEEQSAMADGRAETVAIQAKAAAAKKRGRPRTAQNLEPFSVEGDDAIVEYDIQKGVIETRYGKTFFTNRKSGVDDSAWQEYPVSIHYRCDRALQCTLMHAGAGALRARMNR